MRKQSKKYDASWCGVEPTALLKLSRQSLVLFQRLFGPACSRLKRAGVGKRCARVALYWGVCPRVFTSPYAGHLRLPVSKASFSEYARFCAVAYLRAGGAGKASPPREEGQRHAGLSFSFEAR
jgi:hypothetical protein